MRYDYIHNHTKKRHCLQQNLADFDFGTINDIALTLIMNIFVGVTHNKKDEQYTVFYNSLGCCVKNRALFIVILTSENIKVTTLYFLNWYPPL
jgi:cbb3-type cytochrome oxidase subunit 1